MTQSASIAARMAECGSASAACPGNGFSEIKSDNQLRFSFWVIRVWIVVLN
jgi:hypothetical protein